MTVTNSCCWPNSFSHLIVLLSTLAVTTTISTNHLNHGTQQWRDLTPNHNIDGRYDRSIDNKRYDNLFDFKTDINNLLFRSHGNLITSSRKRRAIAATPSATTNLILDLSSANLTDLMNVNLNETVTSLNLSHNFLSTFNSSKFRNLTALDLSYNRLDGTFYIDDGGSMATLDLSRNTLLKFNCSACKRLQTLNLSHNALSEVSIDNLTSLQYLDLSANLLDAFKPGLLRNKSNLSDLILACNRISVINKDLLKQLKELRRLDLSHNDISDIESDAFSELNSLQILDLSFNKIHIASLQTIQNIPQLNRLSIGGNVMLRNALRAFAVTWSIMELDYSHVGLCQVPDSLAQSVRILNLYGNFLNIISSGDFESYPFLHKLVLSHNNLTSIEEDALGRLEMLTILHLDHNKLTQIPPSLPSSLIKLYMHNNLIMELHSNDLMNLINLQVLDLSYNKLIYMPQLALPALITLSVTSCGLESVEYAFLKTSRNLRQLLIDGNPIKCSQHPLIEIEQCYDMQTLSNEYINDDYDIPLNFDDLERKERHFNFISSFFANNGGIEKCGQKWNGGGGLRAASEIVPNCWSEQKLITSFIRTNEKVASTTAANDNKFLTNNSEGEMSANPSSETTTTLSPPPKAIKDENVTSQPSTVRVMMKNLKTTNNKNESSATTQQEQISKLIQSKQEQKMNNLILMKTKQFKSDSNSIQLSTSSVKSTITSSSLSSSSSTIVNDNGKVLTQLSDKKSREDANGASLRARKSEDMEATHDYQQQHVTINQTISEHWNAIRVENLSHPGLFIVFTISSIGVLFTLIVVYVYRCNITRARHLRRDEGTRDILNDNFNEEIRSFTIERCEAIVRDRNDNLLTTTSSTVNQCDLLPMDILNSTLNQSQHDRGHISMHLW